MQCADFERRLNVLLDERRPAEEDAQLQLHAADCADCQQLLTGQARLLEMVRYEITPLPEDFSERTVRLRERENRVRVRKASVIAAILATAATLLIVAAPIARRFNDSQQRAKLVRLGSPAKHSRQATAGTIANWQPGVGAAKGRESPPQTLTQPVESEEFRRMIQDLWRNLPQVPDDQFEPIDRLAGGFRPLASTIGVAFDAIRRSLPVGRDQEPTEPQANFLGWHSSIRLG